MQSPAVAIEGILAISPVVGGTASSLTYVYLDKSRDVTDVMRSYF